MPASASPDAASVTAVPDVDHLLSISVTALGGSAREGQQLMAHAVAAAIDTTEHLVVQAGTGTGKTLGYLVPAIRHAASCGERVVVSTATLALQRQLITRDLPMVTQALASQLPRPVSFALLKGWHNYLCVHKIAGGYPPDDLTLFEMPTEPAGAADHPRTGALGSLGEQVVRLREWAQETETGDRDDLVPGVPERAWRQVSVTALECMGSKCPMLAECFPERARAAAREADVVVTNHAMLGIAATGSPNVLPEHDVLIVDEAHELAERVTAAATVELSVSAVETAMRMARRHGGVASGELEAANATLANILAGLPDGRFPDGLPGPCREAVEAVRDGARGLLSALKPEPGPAQAGAAPEAGMKLAQAATLQLFEIAERMGADPTGHDVLWCARPGSFGQAEPGDVGRLYAAPLVVAGLIRTHLLTERTGIFASATLALGGSFGAVAASLGLDPAGGVGGGTTGAADKTPWRGIDVGSPFDYPRQGICYIAKHLPTPGREGLDAKVLDEIVDLIDAANGRTLGLFSSRRAAVAAAEVMRDRLKIPVLCQGDDQLPTLVAQFAADPKTCLFGTLSLWQGVDVPGDACQLVIIDRIPFPRPDDPVKSARSRAADAAGGNGFMQVYATHAALLLAQGAGRLIRSTEDRGAVAILDPRMATARYGAYLQRSLPDFWQTTDPDVVKAALRRLAQLS